MLYPALAPAEAADDGAPGSAGSAASAGAAATPAAGAAERLAICGSLRSRYPILVTQLTNLVSELSRITLLWDDRLSSLLAALQADVSPRLAALRDEARRVDASGVLSSADKARALDSKYALVMGPVIAELEAHERAISAISAESSPISAISAETSAISAISAETSPISAATSATPHERSFARAHGAALREAIAAFRAPPPHLDGCWERAFKPVQRELAASMRAPKLELGAISPAIAGLRGTSIPMPGLAAEAPIAESAAGGGGGGGGGGGAEDGRVTIESFCEAVAVLPTKTRPKKLVAIGSDGRRYNYLLKVRTGPLTPNPSPRTSYSTACATTYSQPSPQP